MDNRLTREHRQLARTVAAVVMRYASGPERTIPNTRRIRDLLKQDIWRLAVRPYYIGNGQDPFDGNEPQSQYARLVYDGVRGATEIAVDQQINLVLRRVNDPLVVQWLTGPRPLREIVYDPFHRFVDPNGYTLSDRVWQTSINVRSRIDRLLEYHITRGTSAVDIGELLEDFLTPGARLIRTRTPYGREGSYAARRLARTEITAAAGRATVNASIVNPFVEGIRWVLSGTHGKPDECDANAHGGPNRDGIYPPEQVPPFPNHPHDKCHLQPVPVGSTADLVEDLRRDIAAGMKRRIQGVLNRDWLIGAILNGTLTDIAERVV